MYYRSNIRRNLEFIKASFYLLWKRLIEYKVNTLSSLVTEICFIFVRILFFYILTANFTSLEWNLKDFILFFVLYDIIECVMGTFWWGLNISRDLKRGEFNNILVRPKNPFAFYIMSRLASTGPIMIMIQIIGGFLLIKIINIRLFNYCAGSVLTLVISLYFFLLYTFLESFGFVFLNLDKIIFQIVGPQEETLSKFGPTFFKNFKYKYLLNILPAYFTGTLLVPIFRGHSIPNIEFQISLLFVSLIFFAIGTMLLWRYGLRKYEAYG